MVFEILMWVGAINLVLLIRVMLHMPKAMRLGSEAGMLKEQAALLRAEVDREKVNRGVTDADYQREQRMGYEAQTELLRLKREIAAKETPCDTAEQS